MDAEKLRRKKTNQTYQDMKGRCYNEKTKQFKNYGARGIVVCDRWMESFENFIEDMGLKPDGLTIDRIENNGNYEPGNCRWATPAEQRENQRNCNYIEFKGERKLLRSFAIEFNISEATLLYRIKKGMSVEGAILTPIDKRQSAAAKRMLKQRWSAIAAQGASNV